MKIGTFLLALMSILSFSAFAAENIGRDSNQQLLASCQALATTSGQMSAKHCIYFIQGFLAAAQTIDPPALNKQSKKSSVAYGLMSRSPPNWYQMPPTRLLPFCIPEDESEAHIIEAISKQLPAQIDTAEMLSDIIPKAFIAEYPCGQI